MNTNAPVSSQEIFVRGLASKGSLAPDSAGYYKAIIEDIVSKTRFKGRYTINSAVDSNSLNFFFFNPGNDSSLINVCAYIGHQIILIDRSFLSGYLKKTILANHMQNNHLTDLNRSFQYWVISHEVAHADLRHGMGHFIYYVSPHTQDSAKLFQKMELDADARSRDLIASLDRNQMQELFIDLFNIDYNNIYGCDSTNKSYLKVIQDPYLTYSYRLSSSHPIMAIRTAQMLHFLGSPELKKEADQFLVQSQIRIIQQ